jgi:hypothetical protein
MPGHGPPDAGRRTPDAGRRTPDAKSKPTNTVGRNGGAANLTTKMPRPRPLILIVGPALKPQTVSGGRPQRPADQPAGTAHKD